jgi:hypothetical protein
VRPDWSVVGVAVDLPVILEVDCADRLAGRKTGETFGARPAIAAMALVLLQPVTRRPMATRCGGTSPLVAQRIGFVVERRRAKRERALTRCATPQLHDLQLLLSRAEAGGGTAAMKRAGLRPLGGERDAGAPGNGYIGGSRLPYHEPHEIRKEGTHILVTVAAQ